MQQDLDGLSSLSWISILELADVMPFSTFYLAWCRRKIRIVTVILSFQFISTIGVAYTYLRNHHLRVAEDIDLDHLVPVIRPQQKIRFTSKPSRFLIK